MSDKPDFEDDYAEFYDLYDQTSADDEYSESDNPELVLCEFYGKQGSEVPALEESCMARQCYRCYFWHKGFVAAWIDAELHGYRREATR